MTYHPSHDDPRPTYPKHCPVCGATVHPIHQTGGYMRRAYETGQRVPPANTWIWHWTARCWNGHLVEALPEQLRPHAMEDQHE